MTGGEVVIEALVIGFYIGGTYLFWRLIKEG